MSESIRTRIRTRSVPTESGCWEWALRLDKNGYGRITCRGKHGQMAHRVSYEVFVGPISDGMEIDHTCRNRRCVNPDHLEAVTPAENKKRAPGNQARLVCRNGHRQDADTTRVTTRSNGQIHRACRACERAAVRRYRDKRRSDATRILVESELS